MLNYKECKKIAIDHAKYFNATVDKAYRIGTDYAFDNSKEKFAGRIPFVVSAENGECVGLWSYLNDHDMSMDDMEEITYTEKAERANAKSNTRA